MSAEKPDLSEVLNVLDTWIGMNDPITEMDLNYETGKGAKVRIIIRKQAGPTGGVEK